MKKYLLVNLIVLFAAAFLWAADATIAEPKIDVEADATVSWGVDFGSGTDKLADRTQHGFKNKVSWKVKFPLIKKGDLTSANSEVPVYGVVTLKNIELNIQSKHDKNDKKFALDGKVDKLEAKFVFYGAYLTVYNKPGFKTNYANLWDPLEKSDDYKDVKGTVTYKFEPGFEGYGTKLGYANKDFMDLDVGLKFGSNGDWEAEDGEKQIDFSSAPGQETVAKEAKVPSGEIWFNVLTQKKSFEGDKVGPGTYLKYKAKAGASARHSKYGIGLDFSMKPLDKMLGIKLGVNSTFAPATAYKDGKDGYRFGTAKTQAGDKYVFNIGAEVTSEPIDALKFTLGFDGGSTFKIKNVNTKLEDITTPFAWDMLFKTEYKWISGGIYAASAGTPYAGLNSKVLDGKNDKTHIADMSMYVQFETKGDKKEASYLMEGLDAGVHLGFYDLLTFANSGKDSKVQLPMLMKLWGSYQAALNDSMWIKPFATVWAETNHHKNATSTTLTKPYVGVAYDLGVTYSPVEKVEITAKWAHGKVDENKYGGGLFGYLIKDPANYRVHNGTFVLSLKVEY